MKLMSKFLLGVSTAVYMMACPVEAMRSQDQDQRSSGLSSVGPKPRGSNAVPSSDLTPNGAVPSSSATSKNAAIAHLAASASAAAAPSRDDCKSQDPGPAAASIPTAASTLTGMDAKGEKIASGSAPLALVLDQGFERISALQGALLATLHTESPNIPKPLIGMIIAYARKVVHVPTAAQISANWRLQYERENHPYRMVCDKYFPAFVIKTDNVQWVAGGVLIYVVNSNDAPQTAPPQQPQNFRLNSAYQSKTASANGTRPTLQTVYHYSLPDYGETNIIFSADVDEKCTWSETDQVFYPEG